MNAATQPVSQDDVLRAGAYLSRVAEPANLAVWAFVRELGYVEAAAAIRSGDVPADVRTATVARHLSCDPDADLEAADRASIRLLLPTLPGWPHLGLSPLEHTATRLADERLQSVRRRGASAASPDAEESRKRPLPVPPIALWVRGNGDLTSIGLESVSIVGARAATAYGTHVASEFGFGLATRGFTIVSGGAFGIDAAAHRGALAVPGSVVLVSAAGPDRIYPAANSALFSGVMENGLVVSERPPGSAPHRQRFLARNRLIASLGRVTVLVEAGHRSGALNTAGYCRDLGRPLLAVPGPITSAMSVGCHSELRRDEDAAHLVTSVADVLQWLGRPDDFGTRPNVAGQLAAVGAECPPDDSDLRHMARDRLARRDLSVLEGFTPGLCATESVLSRVSGQPIENVQRSLTVLIGLGLVEAVPAGYRLLE